MSTLSAINLKHPSAASNIALDASGNASLTGSLAMGSSFLRNKIINGAMVIDQRAGGATVTPLHSTYALDRWKIANQIGTFTVARSTVVPNGTFTNSLLATVTTAGSAGANLWSGVWQPIEGFNVSDLGWGTAAAQPITVSFWVRSSLAGTYAFSINNAGFNLSYIAPYTVNAANTWEQKIVTIPGPTTGTWETGTGVGLNAFWGLNSSTTYGSSTTNSWFSNATVFLLSSQANWCGTVSNTFHLTGVQLEVGTVATPFERRQYGQELALCQRYTYVLRSNSAFSPYAVGHGVTTTNFRVMMQMPVTMRSAPTISTSGTFIWSFGNAATPAALAANTLNTVSFDNTTTGISANGGYMLTDAGSNNSSITLSAEL